MRNNNFGTLGFVFIMTVVVALLLSFLFYGLKDRVERNEAVYNKQFTLKALDSYLEKPVSEMTPEEILSIFQEQIDQKVINSDGEVLSDEEVEALGYSGGKAENVNMANERKKPIEDRVWPFYEYTTKDGEKVYLISLRGSGLWDEIWGIVALDNSLETITGIAFDHKAETPGLGAEIKDSQAFQDAFIGKKINKDGKYVGVDVVKGVVMEPQYEVDGISGATITGDGVAAMFEVGINAYDDYFKKIKQ